MFADIVYRSRLTTGWRKIPWHDPDFSRRMLLEHLSQAHDAASRRFETIDRHVTWIHEQALGRKPSAILDLGCGPGLYSARLAALGHRCTGIDFSPASIAYARQHSDATFLQADMVTADYGSGYDLVMLLYGELNAFAPEDAARILDKAYVALKPGGLLLLEPHTYDTVVALGNAPRTWYSATSGLFADAPYLCLEESYFEAGRSVTVYYVIDAETGKTTTYVSMHHAYSDDAYRVLLSRFSDITFYSSLAGVADGGALIAISARKPA
jgi:SAM-dependent methyltransferase